MTLLEKIIRVKPVIEADQALMTRLINCFDHQYGRANLDPSIKAISGGSRNIFIGLGSINDGQEDIHLALKLGKGENHYRIYNLSILYCPAVAAELDVFNDYNELKLVGAICHRGYQAAGVIIEDLSQGGKYQLSQAGGLCDDDYLEVNGRKVLTDGKRYDGFLEDGRKFFFNEARINID